MTEHVHTFEVEPKSGIALCTDPTCRQMERKPQPDTGDVAALREAKTGHIHTAIMNAIKADLERQHPDAFTEDSDCALVIPSGVTPQTAYVKIDVSALAEAAMPSVAVMARARAFIDACAAEGELTPNDKAENPCDLVDAIDAALSKPNAPGAS